jgi:hypothetical protein
MVKIGIITNIKVRVMQEKTYPIVLPKLAASARAWQQSANYCSQVKIRVL